MSNLHPSVCFYFRSISRTCLKDLRITDIGELSGDYFDDEKNKAIFRKVAEKCYLPANARMLDMIRHNPEFRISALRRLLYRSVSSMDPTSSIISGTGCNRQRGVLVRDITTHSLVYGFAAGILRAGKKHADTIEELFGKRPVVFPQYRAHLQ